MPLKYFECPDGGTISTEDCIEKCRMSSRCMSTPSLRIIKSQGEGREWDGVPHVTDLVGNGTRAAYLKYTMDFSIRPWKDPIDTMLGSAMHMVHEKVSEETMDLAEYKVELRENGNIIVQGSVDYLELIWLEDEDLPAYDMYDYKTWGTYNAMRALGLKKVKKAIMDVSPDLAKESWQMNSYRVAMEETGFSIRNMYVAIFVKEGGWVFKNSGLDRKAYVKEVPYLPDHQVKRVLSIKSEMLRIAMETMVIPSVCTPEERWDGDLKCKEFCEVADFCSHGKLLRMSIR